MLGWLREDRVDLWTPINCYEWPVPIPKDADLNLTRIEMLNQQWLISEGYVWLDVLCLRQESGKKEDLRAEEVSLQSLKGLSLDHDFSSCESQLEGHTQIKQK